MRSLADASNTLSLSLRQRHLDLSAATARLGSVLPDVLRRLAQHLDDEEDLIIPLMLERGEAAFDVG
jgi:hypothetical protein